MLPPPRTYRIVIQDGDGVTLTVDAVHYSIEQGMIFWTNTDRTIEAVNLDRVAYLHVTPPALEEA